jgi:hypothetical protein
MKHTIKLVVLLAILFAGCKEEMNKPLVSGKGSPGGLKELKVENIPGGAKISYVLPGDADLLYIEAIYSSRKGEQRYSRSSLYKNFIQIEGFADTREYEITLYAVNKSENKSETVTVKIQPKTPPIQEVFESLAAKEDFGGINIKFVNRFGNEFTINTLRKEANGTWPRIDRLYTTAKSRDYSIRGMEAVEREFAFYVTDAYMNVSDTLYQKITPLYEEILDKKLWKRGNLLTDFYTAAYPASGANPREVEKLWDDKHGTYDYYIQVATAPSLPSWFSIDLGKQMRLSRLLTQQYEGTGQYMYALGNPREYEIWGSNELQDDWSHWTKLMTCVSVKPSGLPLGVRTAEDLEYAKAGENYAFPLDAPPVRYIRFVLKKTWANTNALLLDEITLWGQTPQ